MSALAQLCANDSGAEDKKAQELLVSKKVCSTVVEKLKKLVPTSKTEYGEGQFELIKISHVLLRLSNNAVYASDLVNKHGLCKVLVLLMTSLGPDHTEPALVALKIISSITKVKESLALFKTSKTASALQVMSISNFTQHRFCEELDFLNSWTLFEQLKLYF